MFAGLGHAGDEVHQQVGDLTQRRIGGQLGGERLRRAEQGVVGLQILLDAEVRDVPAGGQPALPAPDAGRDQAYGLRPVGVGIDGPGDLHAGRAAGIGPCLLVGLLVGRAVGRDPLGLLPLRLAHGAAAPGGGAGELQPVAGASGGGGRRVSQFGVTGGGLPQPPPQPGRGRVEHLAEAVERRPLQHLVQPRHGGVEEPVPVGQVLPERLPGAREGTGAHTQFEAAAAELVERRRVLGGLERVLQREHQHTGAQPDARGVLGDRGEHDQGCGDVLVALAEVPLDDPSRVVAQFLGGHEQVDRLPVGPARRQVAVEVQQEAQAEGPAVLDAGPDRRGEVAHVRASVLFRARRARRSAPAPAR